MMRNIPRQYIQSITVSHKALKFIAPIHTPFLPQEAYIKLNEIYLDITLVDSNCVQIFPSITNLQCMTYSQV